SRAEGCWTFDARDGTPRQSRLTAYSAENARTLTRPPPARAGSFHAPFPTLRGQPIGDRTSAVWRPALDDAQRGLARRTRHIEGGDWLHQTLERQCANVFDDDVVIEASR